MSGRLKDSRIRKLESRNRARRFKRGSRAYLHAMTNSRVERSRSAIDRVEAGGVAKPVKPDRPASGRAQSTFRQMHAVPIEQKRYDHRACRRKSLADAAPGSL